MLRLVSQLYLEFFQFSLLLLGFFVFCSLKIMFVRFFSTLGAERLFTLKISFTICRGYCREQRFLQTKPVLVFPYLMILKKFKENFLSVASMHLYRFWQFREMRTLVSSAFFISVLLVLVTFESTFVVFWYQDSKIADASWEIVA